MKTTLILLILFSCFVCDAQMSAQAEHEIDMRLNLSDEPSTDDMTGYYLSRAGTRMITGVAIQIAAPVISYALYYASSDPAFLYMGIGGAAVGFGVSVSAFTMLNKAGKEYNRVREHRR